MRKFFSKIAWVFLSSLIFLPLLKNQGNKKIRTRNACSISKRYKELNSPNSFFKKESGRGGEGGYDI